MIFLIDLTKCGSFLGGANLIPDARGTCELYIELCKIINIL